MKPTVLIVDDDEEIRTQMRWGLVDDYSPILVENRETALTAFDERRPAVVLLDLGLPPHPNDTTEGMMILGEILSRDPSAHVIVITGQSDREHALKAIQSGAYDFLPKPIEMTELKTVLRRAAYVSALKRENKLAPTHTPDEQGFEGIIGQSASMEKVFSEIAKVSVVDAPALLLGESGTGKEMAAKAIHLRSPRRDRPFVAINCGAIPESLLESELFGHEKGSFTGAHAQRKGRVETAEGGTLFLDEIGEMPLSLQVKLLRFLQERKIERIGGRVSIDVDVRIVAATNQDLQKSIAEGTFREDLYFRLAVVNITMPRLSERPGDIRLLAESFINTFAEEHGRAAPKFTQAAMRSLEHFGWPGNVRELHNRIRRAFIMHEGPSIQPQDLELVDEGIPEAGQSLKEARDEVEKNMIIEAMARNQNKISHAANDLGISRPTLYELMDKHGLRGE
jgi:two-component system NtrC family response regulator